ncbi:MAG: hypothetical protein QHJ73_15260 [Armatimonadota bacterium]|nr:hypothetical protein [Armatimonadota bacterium]
MLALLVVALPLVAPVPAAELVGRELLRDPHFRGGFHLLQPSEGKRVVCDTLRVDPLVGEVVWDLAQWNSRYSLAGTPLERLPGGVVRYRNAAKAVTVGPPGSSEGDLSLAVYGRTEYGERARRKGEAWPHLLVSQTIQESPTVAEMGRLLFHIEVRLRQVKAFPTPDYTPSLHAAQFQAFLTVQNRNRKSPGYGDFLWLGIPLYDDRHRIPRAYTAPDQALKKFIYTPPGETYTAESAHGGAWIRVERDLLPIIGEALSAAWERGFLKDSRDPADYRLGGFNLGWEVPGILDVEMQARGLSLKVFPP